MAQRGEAAQLNGQIGGPPSNGPVPTSLMVANDLEMEDQEVASSSSKRSGAKTTRKARGTSSHSRAQQAMAARLSILEERSGSGSRMGSNSGPRGRGQQEQIPLRNTNPVIIRPLTFEPRRAEPCIAWRLARSAHSRNNMRAARAYEDPDFLRGEIATKAGWARDFYKLRNAKLMEAVVLRQTYCAPTLLDVDPRMCDGHG
jgi:hypothetical protein